MRTNGNKKWTMEKDIPGLAAEVEPELEVELALADAVEDALAEDKDESVVRVGLVLDAVDASEDELEDGASVELEPVGLRVLKIDAGNVVELPSEDAISTFVVGELLALDGPDNEDELVIVNCGEMFPESPITVSPLVSE